MKFKVKVKGISPLLFHRFPTEEHEDGAVKVKKAELTKEAQVERSLYRMSKEMLEAVRDNKDTANDYKGVKVGDLYLPSEHFVGALIKAGSRVKLEGKMTYKEVVKAGVFVDPIYVVFKDQSYVADWRPIVNQTTKGRSMCGRGRKERWELEFTLTCIDPRATPQDLEEVVKAAGAYFGVGAYRPRYGRFEVTSFEKLS